MEHDMLKQFIAAREAKNHFGELLDTAQKVPVTIAKKGRPIAVVMSIEEYKNLKAAKLMTQQPIDFKDWIGYAKKAPQNPRPKFRTHDDLWQEDK
jgi:prevent-host-death family protein